MFEEEFSFESMKHYRKDFPCLERRRNGKPPIYFDNACMTLKPKSVIDAISAYYNDFPACGGYGRSLHWFSQEVQERVLESREKIRRFINARKPGDYSEELRKSRRWRQFNPEDEKIREIVFLKNATEGLNLVAYCFDFKEGDVVLTTDHEHNSNLVPWLELERRKGIKHEVVPSNEDNTFNFEKFEEMLSRYRGKVKLISMAHTSNLDGYTIPAERIIKTAHDYGVKVMLDGAQSAPHKKIDVQSLDVDFFVFSIHKMCGPSGVGVLYAKAEEIVKLDKFIVGGDTVRETWYDRAVWTEPPYLFEAGLQDYAGQIGAGAAAEYLMKVGLENIAEHEYRLNKYITDGLLQHKEIKILGPSDPKLRSGIISFRVVDEEGKLLVLPHDVAKLLDENFNIMLRSGAHCVHSWFNERGMGMSGSARVSLYLYNTKHEADVFLSAIRQLIEIARGERASFSYD
jgi:cysteine desulfurase/selenocysteine lyase